MGDPTEELEPLFDYSRVQPHSVVCLDDDDSEASPVSFPKRAKISVPAVGSSVVNNPKNKKVVEIEDKEEDWLPPPPKVLVDAKDMCEENSTLKELRLKKQELALFALSAKNLLQSVEESAKADLGNTPQDSLEPALDDQTPIPPQERAKIVITVQDEDGTKQFRLFTDDKLERLFKMYAEKLKLDPKSLVFVFDGEKLSPEDTPVSRGMEDEDMIEVHVKPS